MRATKSCIEPGCTNPVSGLSRRCPKHGRRARSHPRSWKRIREEVLGRDSLCRHCRFRLATEVEQIVPGSGYEVSNLRGVCWHCYRRARRDQRTERTLTQQIGSVGDEPPAGCGVVVVTRGPASSGKRFVLDGTPMVAGRQPDSGVRLSDSTVSRQHAEFSQDDGKFVVRDLGSLNGTYVNNKRVDSAVLTRGDEVHIGAFRLAFFTTL